MIRRQCYKIALILACLPTFAHWAWASCIWRPPRAIERYKSNALFSFLLSAYAHCSRCLNFFPWSYFTNYKILFKKKNGIMSGYVHLWSDPHIAEMFRVMKIRFFFSSVFCILSSILVSKLITSVNVKLGPLLLPVKHSQVNVCFSCFIKKECTFCVWSN